MTEWLVGLMVSAKLIKTTTRGDISSRNNNFSSMILTSGASELSKTMTLLGLMSEAEEMDDGLAKKGLTVGSVTVLMY